MSEKREVTQDHLDGMAEAFKICTIHGFNKSIADKEMADTLSSVNIKKPDLSRQIQIDVITNTKEVQIFNEEVEKAAALTEKLAAGLQKLGVNFLAQ